jgi:thymidine phosphorylase
MSMEPFRAEALAHQLIEIGTRLQAAAFAIAEAMGHPSSDELADTCERVAREAIRMLDHFQTQLVPRKGLPWP